MNGATAQPAPGDHTRPNGSSVTTTPNGTASNNPNNPWNGNTSRTPYGYNNTSSGGGWGLWGLAGLIGLIGLARRGGPPRTATTMRDTALPPRAASRRWPRTVRNASLRVKLTRETTVNLTIETGNVFGGPAAPRLEDVARGMQTGLLPQYSNHR